MSKSILSNVIMLAVGATVGSVVTWKVLKTKYENLIQEEIESVREAYFGALEAEEDDEEEEPEEDEEEVVEEPTERDVYRRIAQNAGYINDEDEKEDEEEVIEPYVIIPEEFDENGYETVSLYYYEDGVVETMLGKEVLDEDTIEEWVGLDSLNHFGEYEEDSVFVRNDNMKTDFEILKVAERYHAEEE